MPSSLRRACSRGMPLVRGQVRAWLRFKLFPDKTVFSALSFPLSRSLPLLSLSLPSPTPTRSLSLRAKPQPFESRFKNVLSLTTVLSRAVLSDFGDVGVGFVFCNRARCTYPGPAVSAELRGEKTQYTPYIYGVKEAQCKIQRGALKFLIHPAGVTHRTMYVYYLRTSYLKSNRGSRWEERHRMLCLFRRASKRTRTTKIKRSVLQ
jgi:hypothetical protein